MTGPEASDIPGDAGERADSTQIQILNAAERHFATLGYAGATVRGIAEAAKANLGLFHYYWRNKSALFRAVCERRLRPIMNERLRRFAELNASAAAPDIGAVIRASVEPALKGIGESPESLRIFRRFYGQALVDPAEDVRSAMTEVAGEAAEHLHRVMRRACPHLDDEEFAMRIASMRGATIYLLSRTSLLPDDVDAAQAAIEAHIHALTSMMTAPPRQA